MRLHIKLGATKGWSVPGEVLDYNATFALFDITRR